MPFEIVPGCYFVGFFYLDFPAESPLVGKIGPFGKGGNLQSLIWKDGEEPPALDEELEWHMRYRFRYYRDARIHQHKDKMNWFGAKTKPMTEAKAIEMATMFVAMSGEIIDRAPHVWLIQGGVDKFAERMKEDPPYWMHLEPNFEHPEVAKEFERATMMNRAKKRPPDILEGPMR